ncbi:hypothetical protein E8E13_007031 [Curvularia kusanoi]|uniref:Uncharacterized protein n=1 Tax=Curvularia kusanoi TaxID=90978 RepID=A0A9P4TBR3_CURKU|nr:hypothetical protein E8E13_007031 [Curvularia kusanoi]
MSTSDNGLFGGNVHGDDLRNHQDINQVHQYQHVGNQSALFYGGMDPAHDHPGVHVGHGHDFQAPPYGPMNPVFTDDPNAYNPQGHQQVPAETFGLPLAFPHDPMAVQDDFNQMGNIGLYNQDVPQGYTFGEDFGDPSFGAPHVDYGHQVGNPQGPFMAQNEGFNGGFQHPYFRVAEPAEPIFEGDYRLFSSPGFAERDLEGGQPLIDTPALFEDATDFKEEEEVETPCPKRRKVGGGQQAKARKARPAARPAGVKKNGQVRKVRAPRPKLCKWDETDFIKALIGVVVSCHKDGHKIDFNAAAAVVSPTCSGHALRQAILKARDRLVREGHDFVKVEMSWN